MKILYISNYLDGTGWAKASIEYMLALDAVGCDVVARHIKLNANRPLVPEKILEFSKKPLNNIDVVVQHTLPHFFDYSGKINKNIGLYATETSSIKHSGWVEHINTMDEAWVINQQSKIASMESGVNIPIKVVPHSTDISKFTSEYKLLDWKSENFVFYTIGEWNRRKNLKALVQAFHLEFSPDEPVDLFIKTTPVGIRGADTIYAQCEEIKQHLKLYRKTSFYKKEMIEVAYWQDKELMRLHATADCFVLPSYGEAWAIPAFDALGMGKTPIVTNCTGFQEYINDENGWLVDCIEEPVFGMQNGFDKIGTGRENWWSISINALRKAMREAYENKTLRKQKSMQGFKTANAFSHEKIGHLMKGLLEKQNG